MVFLISPSQLRGRVHVPESKSLLHRELILQWLAGERITVPPRASDDIRLTAAALETLQNAGDIIDCGLSGSTLRFLLPVAMALGKEGILFTGTPRLLDRPLPAPLPMERCAQGIRVTGSLRPGGYHLPAGETSQLISGLLMALPLLETTSEIRLTTPIVSAPYVEMTLHVMERHGVTVERLADGYRIPAPQRYRPVTCEREGDWSAASWYMVYNALAMQEAIHVDNLCRSSLQGDSCIEEYARRLPERINISPTPDLLPALSLLAALKTGHTTYLHHAGFLRGKESDRLLTTAAILNAMGAQVVEESDGLVIHGVERLQGDVTVETNGDHRMAMLAAFAGALADAPIRVHGGESVTKSYPRFWEDYTALGGQWKVIAP